MCDAPSNDHTLSCTCRNIITLVVVVYHYPLTAEDDIFHVIAFNHLCLVNRQLITYLIHDLVRRMVVVVFNKRCVHNNDILDVFYRLYVPLLSIRSVSIYHCHSGSVLLADRMYLCIVQLSVAVHCEVCDLLFSHQVVELVDDSEVKFFFISQQVFH